jgi:[ribosomal protein S5]-alanine N-acetyltransferase
VALPARRRAVIRPLTVDDADELAALLIENRRFLEAFEPPRDERFYTEEGQRDRLEREDKEAFAILHGELLVGTVALSNVVRGPLQSANLGYWVAERFNGRGLATSAVGELIPIAFGELGLHRLEAGTLVDNLASQRVLEKNGFERIGVARGYLHIGGAWRDHLLFQLLAG